MSDTPRLDALEQAVRDLAREVERLRADVRSMRREPPADASRLDFGAAPRVAPVLPPRPRPATKPAGAATHAPSDRPAWQSIGLETLIGRYGALALAALAILLGIGVFLSWAVEHVRLGPVARIALGALTAAGMAGLGGWLRRRGARRFGNVLFGLALAIAHVVAWGAGPYLQVVPSFVALGAAALASAALAALAWREDEEALFAVGLGGALIAPFVTSAGESAVLALLIFGFVVVGSGVLAIGDRAWLVARRLIMAGVGLYAGAALAMPGGALGNLGDAAARAAPAVFALACAWIAILRGGAAHRLPIGRAALAVGIVALLTAGLARDNALHTELIVVAILITVTSYAMMLRVSPDVRVAVVVPLGALGAALTAIPDAASTLGALLAGGWSTAAAVAARLTPSSDETPTGLPAAPASAGHHAVAVLAAALAAFLFLHDEPIACLIAFAIIAASAALVSVRVTPVGLAAAAVLVLVFASVWATALLQERLSYAYRPFLGGESAAAAAIVGAWWAWSWAAARWNDRSLQRSLAAIRLLAPAVTFAWGYIELARAFSREVSTFLIILYLAAFGVGAIVLGRARMLPAARHAGLALAIVGGVRALVQASELGFGLRIATYLVVGAFLLGVAYLYRATADHAGERSAAAPAARP